jgi:DNA-binding NarL/FixJ family response regulator
VRIVIAEDQALLREGLGRLFVDAGHDVVASLGSAEGLLDAVADGRPDLVVVDVRMPPTFTDEGARAAAELKRREPSLGVLVLSQHVETTHAVALVGLGGFGYLLKDRVLDVAEFLGAAERVARGGSALDPQVVAGLVAGRADGDPVDRLTEREQEVLGLVAEGLTNAGIGRRLHLSERTVETHVHHVLDKLELPEDGNAHRRVLAVLTFLGRDGPRPRTR